MLQYVNALCALVKIPSPLDTSNKVIDGKTDSKSTL